MINNKIEQISKQKNKYYITVNNSTYVIDDFYYKILLPYKNKVLDDDTLCQFLAFANAFDILKYQYKYIFLNKLSKKMFYLKLKEKNIDDSTINILISTFIEEGYLNDFNVANFYIDKFYFNKGYTYIYNYLSNIGINKKVIEECLKNYNEDINLPLNIANKIISSNLYSKKLATEKIKQKLLQKGYSDNTINTVLNDINFTDEMIALEKDYKKYLKKYKDDRKKIKIMLYNKGYKKENIELVMEREIDENW